MSVSKADAEASAQAVSDALLAHEAIFDPTERTLAALHTALANMLTLAGSQWSGFTIQWDGNPKPT